MSEDHALVVQRMYEAANRRDFALARELLHPQAELHQLGAAPDAGSSYGREQWERDFILGTLRATGGNISRAAERAGMYRQSFQQKMRELGVSPADIGHVPNIDEN